MDAVNSVPVGGTAVIKLLDNYDGGGVQVKDNKNITFDLNGKSWKIGNPLAGSSGTETNAFQLLKGNTVTFKNGTMSSDKAEILIQNYCNLTIENVKVQLNTPGIGKYALSNNNGKTVIKSGSVIEVKDGNMAMDSFTFGDYDGGNVIVEDAVVKGDVEIANGGKLTLAGGVVEGDVTVYNYSYDEHDNDNSLFTMTSGTVKGDVATSKKGNTKISGGNITGSVTLDASNGAKAEISGGTFGKINETVVISADEVAVITENGVSKTVVGLDNINTAIENAGKGTVVTVIKASENAVIKAPVGVTVKNESENNIKVNKENLNKDGEIIVDDSKEPVDPSEPMNPSEDKEQQGTEEQDNAVVTSDNSNIVLPFALAAASLAAIAAVFVTRRKHR